MTEKIDHSVKIYESKTGQVLSIIYILIFYTILWYLAIKEDKQEMIWLISILSPIGLYYIYKSLKKLNKPPKKIVVISIDGISVAPYGFIEWGKINSECINGRGNGRGMYYFFEFKTKDNKVIEIPAFGLSKNIIQIKRIVKKYRKYYEEYVTPRYN